MLPSNNNNLRSSSEPQEPEGPAKKDQTTLQDLQKRLERLNSRGRHFLFTINNYEHDLFGITKEERETLQKPINATKEVVKQVEKLLLSIDKKIKSESELERIEGSQPSEESSLKKFKELEKTIDQLEKTIDQIDEELFYQTLNELNKQSDENQKAVKNSMPVEMQSLLDKRDHLKYLKGREKDFYQKDRTSPIQKSLEVMKGILEEMEFLLVSAARKSLQPLEESSLLRDFKKLESTFDEELDRPLKIRGYQESLRQALPYIRPHSQNFLKEREAIQKAMPGEIERLLKKRYYLEYLIYEVRSLSLYAYSPQINIEPTYESLQVMEGILRETDNLLVSAVRSPSQEVSSFLENLKKLDSAFDAELNKPLGIYGYQDSLGETFPDRSLENKKAPFQTANHTTETPANRRTIIRREEGIKVHNITKGTKEYAAFLQNDLTKNDMYGPQVGSIREFDYGKESITIRFIPFSSEGFRQRIDHFSNKDDITVESNITLQREDHTIEAPASTIDEPQAQSYHSREKGGGTR